MCIMKCGTAQLYVVPGVVDRGYSLRGWEIRNKDDKCGSGRIEVDVFSLGWRSRSG